MACYHPLTAYQSNIDRSIFFYEKGDCNKITLPCGQCIGCRLERSRQWATRCMHESKMHDRNSFITLTYAPEYLPPFGSLDYSHYQKFMKRLRKKRGKVRFYMAGEYGEQFSRPHFHAILFGTDFPDRKPYKSLGSGHMLYTSAELEELWPYGFSSVGEVTFESAAYVARYVMKKVTGRRAAMHYEALDESTGEIFARTPEFNRMSLKPGIGATWFDKYISDVFPHDRVVINSVETKPPRYYDKMYELIAPEKFEDIKYKRFVDMMDKISDNTDARLASKEIVTKARISHLKRSL